MQIIGAVEASAHLSDLLRRVEGGEEFLLTLDSKPMARLMPPEEPSPKTKNLAKTLAELAEFRAEIAKRGPVLKPGETLKDMAREGLKW